MEILATRLVYLCLHKGWSPKETENTWPILAASLRMLRNTAIIALKGKERKCPLLAAYRWIWVC